MHPQILKDSPGLCTICGMALVPVNAAVESNAFMLSESRIQLANRIDKNTFEPRMVVTGEEDASQIIILSGLENAGEVVVSGAYLLSSIYPEKRNQPDGGA